MGAHYNTIQDQWRDDEGRVETRSRRLQLRIEPGLYAALEAEARRREAAEAYSVMSTAALIRQFCIEGLRRSSMAGASRSRAVRASGE